jgi:hypothetical protein
VKFARLTICDTNYAETDLGGDALERKNRVAKSCGVSAAPTSLDQPLGLDDAAARRAGLDRHQRLRPHRRGGAAGNNMVRVRQDEWDSDSAGGDGNLAKVTEYASSVPADHLPVQTLLAKRLQTISDFCLTRCEHIPNMRRTAAAAFAADVTARWRNEAGR